MGEQRQGSPELEAAATGIVRRDFVGAAAALGAGAVATGRLAAPAAATTRRRFGGKGPHSLRVLQPGEGPGRVGTYIPSTPETVNWGRLPNATTPPVATVPSGAVVTFDTVSHEGILEDQGRDPVAFFGSYGVPGAKCSVTRSPSPPPTYSTTSQTTGRT